LENAEAFEKTKTMDINHINAFGSEATLTGLAYCNNNINNKIRLKTPSQFPTGTTSAILY
jgi:hypothetical protein